MSLCQFISGQQASLTDNTELVVPVVTADLVQATDVQTSTLETTTLTATGAVAAASVAATGTVSAAQLTSTSNVSGQTLALSGTASVGGDLTCEGLIYAAGATPATVTATAIGKSVGQAPNSYVVANQQLKVNGPTGIGVVYDTVNLPATSYLALPGNAGGTKNLNLPGFGTPPEPVASYPIPANLQAAQMYEFRLPLNGTATIDTAAGGPQQWNFYITNTIGAQPDGNTTSLTLYGVPGSASSFTLAGGVSPTLLLTGAPNSSYFTGGLLSIIYDGNPTDSNLYLYCVGVGASTGGGIIPNLTTTALITAYN